MKYNNLWEYIMKINKKIQAIYDKIIKAMETGAEWSRSWTEMGMGLPKNPCSKITYRGMNTFILLFELQDKDYPVNNWATYIQWKKAGRIIPQDTKGVDLIKWKVVHKKDENGNETDETYGFYNAFTVFNESQLEGYEPPVETDEQVSEFAIQWKVEEYVQNTNASVKYSETGGAFYHPKLDYINMPNKTRFFDTKDSDAEGNYYATLLHELVHWTGAEDRCNRSGVSTKGKDKDIDDTFRGSYAFEELVAELGATILSVQLGVEVEPVANHSAYLNNWLKSLKNDPSAMMTAFSKSTKAIMYLDDMQSKKKAVA